MLVGLSYIRSMVWRSKSRIANAQPAIHKRRASIGAGQRHSLRLFYWGFFPNRFSGADPKCQCGVPGAKPRLLVEDLLPLHNVMDSVIV